MFEWWREKKREKLLEQPFPEAYREVLERNVKPYARLDEERQQRLCDLVQVFLAEKSFEGCGGLELTDEIKVTIAGHACLLILELPHRMFEQVDSILVYPSTVLRPTPKPSVFERSDAIVASGPIALLGEAHARGPVILAWDRVLRDGQRARDGHNVVYHELAHKLDMLSGHVDGAPPLPTHEQRLRWQAVCERAFLELRARTERGERTFIDEYGAISAPEFFAVATEHFFEQARALQAEEPELYAVLADFYRQDPAARDAQ